ncbi:pseudouridine synthase [Leucobacter komagatae]|uniref:Pseudouridine synthase n=1 Tax=Leucobacter komagatae TaxID=55969 RepID=A0A542Y9B8_9MICO|nr:pseudouridine synthase [Leucobacter komagatae]
MNRSRDEGSDSDSGGSGDVGGEFIVDGKAVEIDMAEWGWDRPVTPSANEVDRAGEEGTVRLQKALANAGVASRRACETLITSGRVTVNGEEQRELGSRVNPETDEVRVDGVVVQLDSSKRYFVLNKPVGVVSTMSDEHGRPDLREFTSQVEERLYNVGRLDTDTSGLLILTNDGELAHKLAHPSFGVEKTYIAKVRGRVTAAVIQQMLDGVELKDGPMRADRAKLLPNGSTKTHSLVELTIHSGKNRIVRRFLAELGHPVEELVRRQLGPLNLGTLRAGELRELSAAERGALLSSGGDGGSGAEPTGARGSSRSGGRGADGKNKNATARGKDRPITAGRPGDGKGAKGMRGIAARGNPNAGRGQADEDRGGVPRGGSGGDRRGDQRGDQRGGGDWRGERRDDRRGGGDQRGRSGDGRGRPMERGWVDNPWDDSRGDRRGGSGGGSRGGSGGRSGGRSGGARGGGPRGGSSSGGARGGRGRAGR